MKRFIAAAIISVMALQGAGSVYVMGETASKALTENDPEILEFVQEYYSAAEEKNEAVLSRMIYPWSDSVKESLYESTSSVKHENINVWSEELGDQEYGTIVQYEKDGAAKEMKGVFLFRDVYGDLRIVSAEDTEHDANNKMKSMLESEEAKTLINQLNAAPTPTPAAASATTPAAASATTPAAVQQYIFPDADKRYLSESEVRNLTLQGMNYAKNEIYARHGRMFKSPELQQYFGSKSWYNGTISPESFSENIFNQYEKSNVLLISKIEKQIAGTSTGYPLDQPGYNINAVLTR